jgi:DNA repair exonuclease SbcCD nuclease subunit
MIFMKLAIIADTHLGYSRFEKDAFIQAERAFLDASQKADVILFAGDVFDTKIPKLETLYQAIGLFKKINIPVVAIHGNHERRIKDCINPPQLLEAAGVIEYIHTQDRKFEKDGKSVQVFGIGNVPDEYADVAVKKAMERFKPDESSFKILMIHQTIKELVPHGKNELALDYLETLPFDLIVNGHIHGKEIRMDGRFIIPGSTVITQLKKDETEQKGYFIFDTNTKTADFIPIECRSFFFEEIEVKDANQSEIHNAINEKINELKSKDQNALISLKIKGTLKQGLSSSDISIPNFANVFIVNNLDIQNLGSRMEQIRNLRSEKLSVRELALAELDEKTKDSITAFSSSELFEKLIEGVDETLSYLEKKSDQNADITTGS